MLCRANRPLPKPVYEYETMDSALQGEVLVNMTQNTSYMATSEAVTSLTQGAEGDKETGECTYEVIPCEGIEEGQGDNTNDTNDDATSDANDDGTNNTNDDATNDTNDDGTNNANDDGTNNANDDATKDTNDDGTNDATDDTTNDDTDDYI